MGYQRFCIGILGGGQLAKMTALAAYKLGHTVKIFAQSLDEPACQVTPHRTIAEFTDIEALKAFVHSVDIVTLENEFIDSSILSRYESKILPRPSFFQKFENKLIEKQTAQSLGIPVVEYMAVDNQSQLTDFVSNHGGGVIKLLKGGYDGYGNFVVGSSDEACEAYEKIKDRDLLVEKPLRFKMEVAQIVARNKNGSVYYPLVETIQSDQICHYTIVPAQVSESVIKRVEQYTCEFVDQLDAIGLYCFEYFVQEDDSVLFNEMAPRPHNSGHLFSEAVATSQFENLVRAITQSKLGDVKLLNQDHVAMVNLLGHDQPEQETEYNDDSFSLHIYGKKSSRKGRKMGHATGRGRDREKLLSDLSNFKEAFRI